MKIGQWNIVEQTYDNWEGLEGEYVVGPDGTVSIALAGTVPAAGLTVHDVSEEISIRVQKQIGTPLPPATSVEIAGFRPVYVVGAVTSPGEFPYRPQMTVLQAVALAGGYLRSDTGLDGILAASRDYEVLGINRRRLIAQLVRLDAELSGAKQIEMPDELAGAPNAQELLGVEAEILAARNETQKSQTAAIQDLKEVLSKKIDSLNSEIAIRKEQLSSARAELEKQSELVKRGIVTASELVAYERRANDIEVMLLELGVAALTAEQQLNEATRAGLNLINERRETIVTESRDAREKLDEIEVRHQTAEAQVALSAGGGLGIPRDRPEPIRQLIRTVEGKITTVIVDENHLLHPGDTLKISIIDESAGSAARVSVGD